MVFRLKLCLLFAFVAAGALPADTTQPAGDWDVVTVPPMKTSIYIGSVTLTAGVFHREGDTFATTYEAKVRPWFFWSETGRITITLPQAELVKLARGERVTFTGQATNHRNKPRRVTGQADRIDAASGKIKVRIEADGFELVFNGSYRFDNVVK
ncbi:MAG TPA: hypothetical protein VHD61_07230 [Lacunisphaera sp.]|nr:hypothetical protein [Lacunisphaera sp.]